MKKIVQVLFTLYLSYNYNNGSLLELSDGSRWTIKPNDVSITAFWITPMEIDIKEDQSDQAFPYKLTSYETKQSVAANKL